MRTSNSLGLKIWVLGYQFPNQNDYWDGNWLNVVVEVAVSGAPHQSKRGHLANNRTRRIY
jgi:hypothetical protein